MKREIFWFLISGFSAVGVDLCTYYTLLQWLDKSPAKGISFVTGSAAAFILNKYLTFQKKDHLADELWKFAVLYSMTLAANVAVNKVVLFVFPEFTFFAFLCATGTSTILNYIGQKFWVFK